MRSFVQKQNHPQQSVSSSPARPNTRILRPNHHTNPLLHLQRTFDNQVVQRMLQAQAEELEVDSSSTATSHFAYDFSQIPVHAPTTGAMLTKLTVNAPGDIYEQEADATAEQVMPRATPTGDAQVQTAPSIVHDVLRSSGQPLDVATRAFMESRFAHDFSRVRVHLDSQAAASARDVGALAYTVGYHIVFAQGQFAPHTASGQHLLAHELAHTVQQSVAAEQITSGDLGVGRQNDPFEHEAERVSASALSARVRIPSEKPPIVSVRPDGRPALRRQPKTGGGTPETPPLQTLPPKEEGGEKAPTPAESACKPPSNITLPCSPKSLPNDDFLKKGAPQEAFGVTRIPSGAKFSVPEVLTKPIGKGKQVVLQPTQATPAPCESFVTKAGPPFWRTVPMDTKERENFEKCGGSYLRRFRITPDGEKKIFEAEMEHCTDYKYAFDISIGCYAAVVNDLAKKGTQFPSSEAAVEAVTKRVGRKPATWADRYTDLLAKSAERDTKGWHTPVEPPGPRLQLEVDRSGRCTAQSIGEINEKSYPRVGKDKHPTPDVIK